MTSPHGPLRVGLGGPVGAGKTALMEQLCKTMRDRWELAGPAARARGDEGNRRLHYRWNTMRARHKKHTVATIAIARELAGWCWSLAVLD